MAVAVKINSDQIHTNFIQIPSSSQFIIRINSCFFLSNLIYSPEITLDTAVFRANHLPSSAVVEYIPADSVEILKSITVSPKSPSDWELVSSNPSLFENLFLSQCQLVFPSQIVILRWKSIVVELVVKNEFGRLVEGSEVTIEPNERFKPITTVLKTKAWKDCDLGEEMIVKLGNYDYEKVVGKVKLTGVYRGYVDGGYVYVDEDAMKELDLVQYSLVKVTSIDTSLHSTITNIKVGMKGDFKTWIRKRRHRWVCDGMCVDGVKITTGDDVVVELTGAVLEIIEIQYDTTFSPPQLTRSMEKFDDYGFGEIDEGVMYFNNIVPKFNLALNLYGPSACGKTVVAKMIAEKLQSFATILETETLNNLSNDDFKAKLENVWKEAVYHTSTVIIKLGEGVKSTEKDVRKDAMEREIKNCVNKMLQLEINCIIVSQEKLSGWPIGLAKGIDNPDKSCLTRILSTIIDSHLAEQVSGILEGYSLGELKGLIGNAKLNAKLRNGNLNHADFLKTVESIKPAALVSSNLSKPTASWEDIGGHNKIKKILLQILKWPSIYKLIFAQSPLRLRSGILLYGYPGCGKTMIAQALAQECSLNLITINGPELLNKYIGESEKSTRNVFIRARSSKPCLLFFDEFESIAPKRGSDSSGVTDRVVNQLLTEIDGAEGLEGVYVLAATSRPDLIDQALLRPGRLDKRVLVDMPGEGDRKEILEKLGGKLEFSIEVDEVVRMTEGFTGADLQGLVAASQLIAIHQKLDVESSAVAVPDVDDASKSDVHDENLPDYVIVEGEEHVGGLISRTDLDKKVKDIVNGESTKNSITEAVKSAPRIVITHEHVLEALKETRSSMMADEKRRLDRIYTKFAGGEVDVNVGSKSAFA